MDFEKVEREHIIKGIQDFEDKGIPDGFKNSTTYDLRYSGKSYPPKVVMVYANYHASGRKIEWYFSGGEGTECFEVLREKGFEVLKKDKVKTNQKLYDLKEEFLEQWPVEKLESLKLEEYTNLDKTSFCYWIEHITRDLGSIVGGSSYKFGIYKRSDKSEVKEESNRTTDGDYAWFKKYGANDKEQAFQTIKNIIIKIVKSAQKDNLEAIDAIDLGNAYKWKIAFLYGDYNCLNVFKLDALRVIASNLEVGYSNKTPISKFHKDFLKIKPSDKEYFSWSHELWRQYEERLINVKREFAKWLHTNTFESYRPYLGNTKKGIENKLDEIDEFFDDVDLFLVDTNKVEGLISTILFLLSKKERLKNPDFEVYDLKNSNGIPKAILGKNNYVKFLREKFDVATNINNMYQIENQSLNQILYGPPGTGKTYSTKKIAVEIIENKMFSDSIEDRKTIIEKYEKLANAGQIHFTTFHQSLSYEDFIEGIKPVFKGENESVEDDETKENTIEYEITDGIFKHVCQLAEGVKGDVEIVEDLDFKNKDFYKMSLGGKNNIEKHKWSIKNNLIFLGWGKDKDFTKLKKIKTWKEFRDAFKIEFPDLVEESKYVIQAVYAFQKMEIGDIVIVSKGNHIIDAIGVIESDYFFDESQEIEHYQFRKVKWLSKNMNSSPELFLSVGISQQTIYQFDNEDVKVTAFEETFKKQAEIKIPKKYVLIIDEINRGNVSSIFGELITLIEEDKRIGSKEAVNSILPYSKKPFAVPSNVHIIGTMNTADRSVEALDTALRRRFSFEEVMPKPYLLDNIEFEEFNLVDVLTQINLRIESLLDRDHTIGHSYFINLESNDTEGLTLVFKNKVIPLLQEYFYNDYEKIALVLGEGFVKKAGSSVVKFPKVQGVEIPDIEPVFELQEIEDIEDAISKLLKTE